MVTMAVYLSEWHGIVLEPTERVMDEVRGKLGKEAISKGRGLKPGAQKASRKRD